MIIKWYRGFWSTVDELSQITDDLAKESMLRGMNSFNELFSAFIAKVLALVAPLPSAFNMGMVLIVTHSYAVWQGVILAAVLELAGYGITERTVVWAFDARTPALKKRIAVSLTVVYYIMLFVVVLWLKGFGVEIIFPVLSAILAMFYALVRHDEIRRPQSINRKSAGNHRKTERNETRKTSKDDDRKTAILAAISEGFTGTGAIANALSLSENTVRPYLVEMEDCGQVEKSGRSWKIPESSGLIHRNGAGVEVAQ